jgi:hypothetical protein
MERLTESMARALEELAKGPALRSSRTSIRRVQFQTAARLVARDLASYHPGDEQALSITDKGREALEAHRIGWR